jgi:hypothetical protein
MAYRSDERAEPVVATTAAGKLSVEIGAQHIRLSVPNKTLVFAEQYATVTEHNKRDRRSSWRLEGMVVVARDVPRDDVGIWIEARDGMLRIFDAAPTSLLDDGGLTALRAFDSVVQRVRTGLLSYSSSVVSAIEVGRGLDKVLMIEHASHIELYARPLFRDRVRPILRATQRGEITVIGAKDPISCTSRYGITVQGDYIRFFDRHGADLARVAIPWITPEDRKELVRRIATMVDRESASI